MLKRLISRMSGLWRHRHKANREYSGPIDVILALDFGMRESDFPLPDDSVCKSNRAMAELVCWLTQFHPSARLVVQDEIGLDIRARHPSIDQAKMRVIGDHETKPPKYLDTRGFLWHAVEHIKGLEHRAERRFNSVLLVCHRAHLWRVKRALEQLLFEAKLRIAVQTLGGEDLKDIPYDRQSSQWWTKGPVRWWFRELLVAIPWYKFRRWI